MTQERWGHYSLPFTDAAQPVLAGFEILPTFSEACCIFKVPERLLELNEKAYRPRVVSIGPIHHGKQKLLAMEEHKRMYLQEFLQLSWPRVEEFVKLITDCETTLRNCYEDTIPLSSEGFIKMMLTDAAFVIMVFLRLAGRLPNNKVDRIFGCPYKINEVRHDLFLLENQLPFFIFEELLKLSRLNFSMTDLTHDVSKHVWNSWVTENIPEEINSSEVQHFLDFLRKYQKPSVQRQSKKLKTLSMPSVKALKQAGVKFEPSRSKKLLSIEFDKNYGRLTIPHFMLEDSTEILFRNLQAFEQCHGDENFVQDYITLMGNLANSAKDVEIMVQEGIIDNWLSNNEEVSTLFDKLETGNMVNSNNFLFVGLIEDLEGYCQRRWNKWKVNLKENYFNTPWAAISVTGAVLLLILSVLQSVCSIIQVIQKT